MYEYVGQILQCSHSALLTYFIDRFPRSLPMVVLDYLERVYLAGFVLLQMFVSLFPLVTKRISRSSDADAHSGDTASGTADALEFLPLMLTSVYCAIGLTWAFLRLSYIYLKPPTRS